MDKGAKVTQPVIAGRYQILSTLGHGAMGAVYLAHDLTLGFKVVIKVAVADLGDVELRERVRREARAIGRLNHPNIGRLIGVFEDQHRPYLVLEYVEGRSLQALLQELGRLCLPDALAIAGAVAEGLAAAHEAGVIHRDLKPSNIIVPIRYEASKIVDFGAFGTLEAKTQMTRAGTIIGTPRFMASEQVLGQAHSAATDVYGLGALLYTMLYGEPPFQAEDFLTQVSNILNLPLAFPDSPAVPERVRSFLTQSLSRDPSLRPSSGRAALAEIRRLQADAGSLVTEKTNEVCLAPGETMYAGHDGVLDQTMAGAPRAKRYVVFCTLSVGWALGVCVFTLVGTLLAIVWRAPYRPEFMGLVAGVMITLAGFPLGSFVRTWLQGRRSRIQEDAAGLVFGAQSRGSLTATLVIEVDKLLQTLKRIDDRILGLTIAIMVKEFEEALEADARQKALVQMISLLDKIKDRLSPWYVRHEKLIAIVVSVITCISGAATATLSMF